MNKTCNNCSWWNNQTCCNGESEYRAEFTDKEFRCENWLGEEII